MLDDVVESEVIEDIVIAATGEVDVEKLRNDLVTISRLVSGLKQEMQQMRNQVQRNHTQLKQLEARVGRR